MTFDLTDAICLICVASGIALAAVPAARALGCPTELPKFWTLFGTLFCPLLAIAALRVAVAEPYRIPSSSMSPVLVAGDFILVDKSIWGIKAPWSHALISTPQAPSRGDVAIFRFPKDPSSTFVKRLVGLPGDLVEYRRKQLWINGEQAFYGAAKANDETMTLDEQLPGEASPHRIALSSRPDPDFPAALMPGCSRGELPHSFACRVPQGSYFAMGDNRDDSLDSRYWGWVPLDLLIGRAFYIWMSLEGLSRIGSLP